MHATSFGTTGVQEITAAAGVPKGSFYSYFESKDAYAVDLLNAYWRDIDAAFGPILQDRRIDPKEAIKRFFKGLVEVHAARGFVNGCLIGNLALEMSATSVEARRKLRSLLAIWTNQVAARLAEIAPAEDTQHAAAQEAAASIIDAFEGAVLRAKVDQNGTALQRFEQFTLPKLLS